MKKDPVKKKIISMLIKERAYAGLQAAIRWECLNIYNFLETLIPKSGKIIDLGCGYGIFSFLLLLKAPDRNVLGIDIISKRINTAINCVNKNIQGNITFRKEDISKYKLPYCSAIVLIDVLYYMPYEKQLKILNNCYKAIMRGGILLVKDTDTKSWWKNQCLFLEELAVCITKILTFNWSWLKVFSGRLYVLNNQDMIDRLKSVGFTDVEKKIFSKYCFDHRVYLCKKN